MVKVNEVIEEVSVVHQLSSSLLLSLQILQHIKSNVDIRENIIYCIQKLYICLGVNSAASVLSDSIAILVSLRPSLFSNKHQKNLIDMINELTGLAKVNQWKKFRNLLKIESKRL